MTPEEMYQYLIARVAKLDSDAAEYLREEAPKLRGFCGSDPMYNGYLSSTFSWRDTPQGHNFWEALALRLEAGEDAAIMPPKEGIAPMVFSVLPPKSESILQEAQRLVHGDRSADYGHPIDDFTCTAQMWSAYLNRKYGLDITLQAEDVGPMMVCVKMSREAGKHKRDNLVDGAGYFETTAMVHEERAKRA